MDYIERTNKIIDWPKAQEDLRKTWSLLSGKTTDLSNRKATAFADKAFQIRKSLEGMQSNTKNWFNKAFSKRFKNYRAGAMIGATLIGLNFMTTYIQHKFAPPKPVIPSHYDRGYDNIKERTTDFGSPAKLIKTASKIITPNFSAVRRAKWTTTNTVINKNMALYNSARAIGHMRY